MTQGMEGKAAPLEAAQLEISTSQSWKPQPKCLGPTVVKTKPPHTSR